MIVALLRERDASKLLIGDHCLKRVTMRRLAGNENKLNTLFQLIASSLKTGERHLFLHASDMAYESARFQSQHPSILIVTKGLGDILDIQRTDKRNILDPFYKKPRPWIPRHHVLEVEERIDSNGQIVKKLDIHGIKASLFRFIEGGVKSVGICLLHSYKNPVHEKALEDYILSQFPGIHVVRSTRVCPLMREYERASTTSFVTLIAVPVVDYLRNVEKHLGSLNGGRGYFLNSSGGFSSFENVKSSPWKALWSNRLAPLVGAKEILSKTKMDELLSIEVGDTKSQFSFVSRNSLELSYHNIINGLPVNLPMVPIGELPLSGSSQVIRGDTGEIEITNDVFVEEPLRNQTPSLQKSGLCLKSVLHASGMLLEAEKEGTCSRKSAIELLQSLGRKPKKGYREIIALVIQSALSALCEPIYLETIRRGEDLSHKTLFIYGEMGPPLAQHIAEKLGMSKVVIPRDPGFFSVIGLLASELKEDAQCYVNLRLRDAMREAPEAFARLLKELEEKTKGKGYPPSNRSFGHFMTLRYTGQISEVEMRVFPKNLRFFTEQALAQKFNRFYERKWGYALNKEIEVGSFKVVLKIPMKLGHSTIGHPSRKVVMRNMAILNESRAFRVQVLERDKMVPNRLVNGPVIIGSPPWATYVPAGWKAKTDQDRNLFLFKGI